MMVTFADHSKLNKLTNTQPPTLVELNDGKSIRVYPIGHNERTPKAIQDFVASKMMGLFDWTGTLPPRTIEEAKKPRPDPGVRVDVNRSVTTEAFYKAFAVSEDFRPSFLKGLASLTPQENFRSNVPVSEKITSTLIIRNVSPPREINKGMWENDVVADLMLFKNGTQFGSTIPVNKTVTTKAEEVYAPPEGASDMAKISYEERLPGLVITEIRDLSLASKPR